MQVIQSEVCAHIKYYLVMDNINIFVELNDHKLWLAVSVGF